MIRVMAKSLTRIDSNFTPFLRDRSSLAIKKKGFCILEYLAFHTQSSPTLAIHVYLRIILTSFVFLCSSQTITYGFFPTNFLWNKLKDSKFSFKKQFSFDSKISDFVNIFLFASFHEKSQRILPLVLKFVFQWEHMFVWSDLNHQNAN